MRVPTNPLLEFIKYLCKWIYNEYKNFNHYDYYGRVLTFLLHWVTYF